MRFGSPRWTKGRSNDRPLAHYAIISDSYSNPQILSRVFLALWSISSREGGA
jgi:hypothetical protein